VIGRNLEGVPNIVKADRREIEAKKIDKFNTVIDILKKYKVLNALGDNIYDELRMSLLRSARIGGTSSEKTASSCLGWLKSACLPSPTPYAASVRASSRPALPSHESDDATMKKTAKRPRKIDWSRADAMTAKQRRAAAWADPDNKPMTEAEWRAAPRVPQVSIIRRALKLSQEEFAAAFHIPIGALRDWEQRRKEPDAAARAYLRVIAREPETVRKALVELRDARRRSRRYQPDAA
jgi:putative transcriptional regulator